jgi:hypothetical protein
MFTEVEISYIESVKSLSETARYSKSVAKQFQKIRNRVLNGNESNCMCGMVYRKIYIKDFLEFYESNS